MSWIVTASEEGARLFVLEGSQLSLIEQLANPAGSPTAKSADFFAHDLADKLCRARRAGKFERLMLVADATFLHTLRKALDAVTASLVVANVSKDLHLLEAHELMARLPLRSLA